MFLGVSISTIYGSMEAKALQVSEVEIPEKFDFRESYGSSLIKNQGTFSTCWAFASLSAVEHTLMPAESWDFSEDHMANNPNFCLQPEDGGEYTMSMAYLLSWQGPILESQDPYGDGVSPVDVTPAKHVQEIQILPMKDYTAIKQAVLLYGGVQSSIYTTGQKQVFDGVYSYQGDLLPNHDIVIVGWDDELGAFLCENSWGSDFGDQGYFYVSYEDVNIGKDSIVYTVIENPDNYDMIYQSDLCGWIGQIGYGEETAWAMNVYQTQGVESLEAVGFYAIGENTEYEIYINRSLPENPSDGQLSKGELVGKGQVDYQGYYTINLDQDVLLNSGERFGVMVKITTKDAVHPIAIEYDAQDGKSAIDLMDGEGYISFNRTQWTRTETNQACNICLKAYTKMQ